MQIAKNKLQNEQAEQCYNKPICFFCNTTIQDGEEIITRKATCYHRACYEVLFTLKSNQVLIEN